VFVGKVKSDHFRSPAGGNARTAGRGAGAVGRWPMSGSDSEAGI